MGGQVRERLVRATGDPVLSVAYRLTDPERWVDADGVEVPAPRPAHDLAVTPLVRGSDVIAAVTHDPSLLAPVDLGAAIRPATRLAIENERLRAGILAELSALRASREQIVAAGDLEHRNRSATSTMAPSSDCLHSPTICAWRARQPSRTGSPPRSRSSTC